MMDSILRRLDQRRRRVLEVQIGERTYHTEPRESKARPELGLRANGYVLEVP